jgi:hypothetical protein
VLKKIMRLSEDEVEEEWKGIASLHNERSSLVGCKRGLLAFEELVDAERRQIRIGIDEKRSTTYYAKIGGAGGVQESSVIYKGRWQ